eukprot:15362153-Ditylum_brightwellii.AAC.1
MQECSQEFVSSQWKLLETLCQDIMHWIFYDNSRRKGYKYACVDFGTLQNLKFKCYYQSLPTV